MCILYMEVVRVVMPRKESWQNCQFDSHFVYTKIIVKQIKTHLGNRPYRIQHTFVMLRRMRDPSSLKNNFTVTSRGSIIHYLYVGGY